MRVVFLFPSLDYKSIELMTDLNPVEGDCIDDTFIAEQIHLTEEEKQDVYVKSWQVSTRVWGKDEKGIYLRVICDEE